MTQPSGDDAVVGLGVGDGLGAMQELLRDVIAPSLKIGEHLEDSACFRIGGEDVVVTADVFSVDPIEFPGGNIGYLAACGVINDLVASGASIEGVTVGLVLSPHLPRSMLRRVLSSLYEVLASEGASVWGGDTKVVDHLSADLLISMSALGRPIGSRRYDLRDTRDGDAIIVTGPLGAHSIAVLSAREGLGFERGVASDVAPLATAIRPLLERDLVHSLRDLTRGGLVGALWDGLEATGMTWSIEEDAVPVETWVRAATDLLGFDPKALTNEGCMLVTVAAPDVDPTLEQLRANPVTAGAARVGWVKRWADEVPMVTVAGPDGREAVLRRPSTLGIPRLC